jgi:hypothetical protein
VLAGGCGKVRNGALYVWGISAGACRLLRGSCRAGGLGVGEWSCPFGVAAVLARISHSGRVWRITNKTCSSTALVQSAVAVRSQVAWSVRLCR